MTKSWFASVRRSFRRSTTKRCSHRWELNTLERREVPAAFTPGNLAIYRVGDGVAALANSGGIVHIDEYTPSGTFVQSAAIMPSTGAGTKLIASGTASSEGQMTLSPDGKYLAFLGYNTTIPTAGLASSNSAVINRTAGVVDSTGAFTLSAFSDVSSGDNPRSAVTTNGTDLWMTGGGGGVRYAKVGDTTSTQVAVVGGSSADNNFRSVNIFGGQLYASSNQSVRLATIGTGIPDTANHTVINLPGFPIASGNPYMYYFADLSTTEPGLDTLYVADDGVGFVKYTSAGGTWLLNSSVPQIGLRGLTGHVQNGTVTLFGATETALYRLTDSSGYGNNINGASASIATASSNTRFRGVAFAPAAATPAELTSLTTPTTTTSAGPVSYTVVFNQAITGLAASNFSLTATDTASGVIGTPTTSDNITWTVPITSITGNGTLRLDLANGTGVTPTLRFVGFSQGTTFNVLNAPAGGAVLDVVAGKASYVTSTGLSNNVTLNQTGANYSVNDSATTITLTAAAKAAGWIGEGTFTVSDTNGGTTSLLVELLDGVDTFTVTKVADPLTATGGGDIGDTASFPNSLTVTGAVSVTGFDSITQTAATTLNIGTLTLGANAIGTSVDKITTKSTTITANAGAGGVYLRELDGVSLTVKATGAGEVSVSNDSGTLTFIGNSVWGSGNFVAMSGDAMLVNGTIGDALTTGTLTLQANTDGAGSQGYTQSTSAALKTTAAMLIEVNNGSGGTGDASLGVASAGDVTITTHDGSIFWNPGFVIPPLSAPNSNVLTAISLNMTSGNSIGNIASPLQLAVDKSITGKAEDGGVYVTDWDQSDTEVNVTATGAGNLQIWAGNGGGNGFDIQTAIAENGNISIKADDALQVTGLVGGPTFTGTVLLEANLDGVNQQNFDLKAGASIQTSNNSAAAVTINTYAQGGKNRLGAITTGAGGTVTVNAAALLFNGTDAARAGEITMTTGTTIDVGPTGSVILNAKDAPIGEPGPTTQIINVVAGNVKATTNSSATLAGTIFINASTAITFHGSTTSNSGNDGVINVTSSDTLTLNGNVSNDNGGMNLSAPTISQTSGTVITTGTLNLSGTKTTFTSVGNKAATLIIPSGMTTFVNGSFDPSGAVQVDGTLAGSGSVGTVTVSGTGKVSPGNSPEKLTTGNIVWNSGSVFDIELNGNVAGTSYDQLAVNGTVNLGGATLTGSLGYTPASGQVFKIIDNDGTLDDVTGTFDTYAEGATVTIGAVNFTISYKGGDGNDVTLKAPGVGAPPTVSSVTFGDGGVHRSLIKQMVVTFSEAVSFSGPVASAFTVFRSGTGAPASTVTLTTNPVTGPASSVTITFSGALTEFGSLIDGFYDFTIDATKVSGTGGALDGDLVGGAGGNYVVIGNLGNKYFRYFGDFNGDGALTQSPDFVEFRNAFGPPSTIFDFDNDGSVDQDDFIKFRNNFGGAP